VPVSHLNVWILIESELKQTWGKEQGKRLIKYLLVIIMILKNGHCLILRLLILYDDNRNMELKGMNINKYN
jgi:hypothetical protein